MKTNTTKEDKTKFWSERRRKYVFESLNPKWGDPPTLTAFLLFINEKTLGYSKEIDPLSLSQFQKVLGPLSERQLRRLRSDAKACKRITTPGMERSEDEFGKTIYLVKYSPQEDFTLWEPYNTKPRKGTTGTRRRTSMIFRRWGKNRLTKNESGRTPYMSYQDDEKEEPARTRMDISPDTDGHQVGHKQTSGRTYNVPPTVLTPVTEGTGENPDNAISPFGLSGPPGSTTQDNAIPETLDLWEDDDPSTPTLSPQYECKSGINVDIGDREDPYEKLTRSLLKKVDETGYRNAYGDKPGEGTCYMAAEALIDKKTLSGEWWDDCKWINEMIPTKDGPTGDMIDEDLIPF